MNKIVLFKSFLAGPLLDCLKLKYGNLNEGYKVCECYGWMLRLPNWWWKPIYMLFFSKHSYEMCLFLQNYCNEGVFFNKEIIIKCLAIKIFSWNILQLLIQKIIPKTWADIPSHVMIPWYVEEIWSPMWTVSFLWTTNSFKTDLSDSNYVIIVR